MKKLITLNLELTPVEASNLCTVLAKVIGHYTFTEEINPVWLWGIMQDLSTAVYEQNTKGN